MLEVLVVAYSEVRTNNDVLQFPICLVWFNLDGT